MSSGAGLGTTGDGDGQGLRAQGQHGVLGHSWAICKAPITPAGYYWGLWQDLGICPVSRRWPCHPQCTFFLPRTSSTASTRVLTLYHRESDPEEEDEEEEELPPKSDTFVNEAYDGKEVSSIWSRPW